MLHRLIILPALLLGICISAFASRNSQELTDSLMGELEKALEMRPDFLRQKEESISAARRKVAGAKDGRERFDALGALYEEFLYYNADSAFTVCEERETIARDIGDPELIRAAMLNKANVFNVTAMYRECLEVLDSITTTDLPDYLLGYYYHTRRTLYGYLSDFSAVSRDRKTYTDLTAQYRDSILSIQDPGTLSYTITYADKLNAQGRPHEAIETIENFCSRNDLDFHQTAMFSWSLSDAYNRMGDVEQQKIQLLRAALGDIRASVREYVALRDLALILYREGDLDRAYRFMAIAVEDAEKCNARQRVLELSRSYPMINSIYVDTVEKQRSSMMVVSIFLALVGVGLLVLLVYARRQNNRISRARKTIQDANSRLQHLNADLKDYIARLSDANSAIAENSELKEVYIGRYMDQCLEYIEKIDTYRKTVAKLLASDGAEKLRKFVKSSAPIDAEFKAFYEQFDKTFLSLFPNFVQDFNALLRPEEAIQPRHPGTLSPELRIYALYRLGITDSDKIAKFLRYSLTTIYNYRTKVRNKAAGDRAHLEEAIASIGR
ncbi:MAG: hypothetical protein K2I37_08440 [Muribaculaceae bacterium]|nr:hypothetical protein [Muribaculaceae bacterium]MDE5958178.1 hypothetical protein [Muribaculaceae bacterium]